MCKQNEYAFGDLTVDWLNSKAELAESSQTAYRGEINRMAEYFAHVGILDVSNVSREAWWNYLSSLEAQRDFVETKRCDELRPGSIQQARRITRDFFMWALEGNVVNWLPRLPNVRLDGVAARYAPRERIAIEPEVAKILMGEREPKNAEECRAHMTFNLVFWGTLKPADLASLRVHDLSDSGRLAVSNSPPKRQVELPAHIVDLWQRYRQVRRDLAGSFPKRTAPLVCHLENEAPLSAWGVWSVFNEWDRKYSTTDNGRMTPRDLRAAYADLLCSDGELRLKLACAHGGIRAKRVQAWGDDIPEGMIAAVNKQIRAYLQTHMT